jgi:hypothetical protein
MFCANQFYNHLVSIIVGGYNSKQSLQEHGLFSTRKPTTFLLWVGNFY